MTSKLRISVPDFQARNASRRGQIATVAFQFEISGAGRPRSAMTLGVPVRTQRLPLHHLRSRTKMAYKTGTSQRQHRRHQQAAALGVTQRLPQRARGLRHGGGSPAMGGLLSYRGTHPGHRSIAATIEALNRVSPTYILGISAFYHDSAACLLRDGEIIAAAQEERFTRKKGDAAFPATGRRVLPTVGRDHGAGPGLRRVLRQAAAQVRAHPGDLSRDGPAGLPVVSHGRPALDQGEAVHRSAAP